MIRTDVLQVAGVSPGRASALLPGWLLAVVRAGGPGSSGRRGHQGAPIDPRLVAVAVPFAQRLPGRQLLRPHPLTVIQVMHEAVQHVLPAGPEEVHAQALLPWERGEHAGAAREPDAGDLIDSHVHRPARRVIAEYGVPPAPAGWPAEHRCCHAREVTVGAAVEDPP